MDCTCELFTNTTFQTIISGVIVFMLGQLFMEYFLKPLQRYRQLRAKAAYCLTYYGNRFDMNTSISSETTVELRKMAAELSSFAVEKPIVVFSIRRKKLERAASYFIGLSNSVVKNPDYNDIREYIAGIKKMLRLH